MTVESDPTRGSLGEFRIRIGAIARRDFIIERSYHFRLAFRGIGIIFSVATFFFVSKLVGDASALRDFRGGYFTFALIGILVVQSSFLGQQTFSAKINDERQSGTLEILLSTPTRLPTFLLGTFLVPLAFMVIEIGLYLSVAVAFFDLRLPWGGVVLATPLLLLTLMVFTAIGILSAAFIVLTKRGDPFTFIGMQATNFLAGAIFPVSLLPGILQGAAHLVPAFYGINGMRAVLLSGAGFTDVLDELLILMAFLAVLLPVALWVFDKAVGAARVTGTLANY